MTFSEAKRPDAYEAQLHSAIRHTTATTSRRRDELLCHQCTVFRYIAMKQQSSDIWMHVWEALVHTAIRHATIVGHQEQEEG